MRTRGPELSKSIWPMLSIPVDGFSFTNVDASALQHMNEPHIDARARARIRLLFIVRIRRSSM